jgi:hypothetical protein
MATGVGDGEGAALQLVGGELLGARAHREILHGLGQSGEREAIGVPHHRHHQPLLGLHGDPHVDVALLDDRVLEHRGVQARELAQRAHRGVHHEGQEGQPEPVRLLEGALVGVADPRDARHVDLVRAHALGHDHVLRHQTA